MHELHACMYLSYMHICMQIMSRLKYYAMFIRHKLIGNVFFLFTNKCEHCAFVLEDTVIFHQFVKDKLNG